MPTDDKAAPAAARENAGGVNAEESAVKLERQRSADLAAQRAQASAAPALVSTDEDDGLISVGWQAPWRVTEFRTPALPGVVILPGGTRLEPEQAQIAYDELKRSGFTPTSSVPLEEVQNSEDVPA